MIGVIIGAVTNPTFWVGFLLGVLGCMFGCWKMGWLEIS